MLSVYLDKFENAIAFQVAKQDSKITNFIKNIGGTFYAGNGWKVRIGLYPELDIAGRSIYLQGDEKGHDLRVDRKWKLESNYNRDLYISQANAALQEVVDATDKAEEISRLNVYGMFVKDTPTVGLKHAGTNSNNKPLFVYS